MQLILHNPDSYAVPSASDLQLIGSLLDEEIGLQMGQVNLVFCDELSIQDLNKQYRGKDKVTDVLTFTYYTDSSLPAADRSLLTDEDDLLGEVFVCFPQLERQASERDWSSTILDQYSVVEMEMYKLCIHGLLHLRGYDHEKDEDFRVMKLLEDKIMKSFLESRKT